jgi:hypothetical protein
VLDQVGKRDAPSNRRRTKAIVAHEGKLRILRVNKGSRSGTFAKDQKSGDVNGDGFLNGAWHVVNPCRGARLARTLVGSAGLVPNRDAVHAEIDRRLHQSVGFPPDDLAAQIKNNAQIFVAAHHAHEMIGNRSDVRDRDVALRLRAFESVGEVLGDATRPLFVGIGAGLVMSGLAHFRSMA